MFAIQLLPPSCRGGDGERLGRITIGRFTELFGCYPQRGQSVRSMAAQWRMQLRRLIAGEQPAVALVTGLPAWIVYRAGKRCYIQQRYFITAASRELGPRRTHDEDGQRISEWSTRTEEIERFITPMA
jgi:hypothetical protein